MSFSDKGSSEDSESLADTLSSEASTITTSNLAHLGGVEIQHFSDLHELSLSEMEMEEQEIIIDSGMDESMKTEMMEEEIVETELGTEEVEVETERSHSPEEILPDIRMKATLPPLRPLTIAPKPAKMPISVKPVPGQQLLLLHGTGAGQTIKFVSPQGQELGTIGRPVTLKSTMQKISPQSNISLIQPKQMIMKKLVTPTQKTVTAKPITFANKGNVVFVQKADGGQLKIVQNQGSSVTVPSPTKTITLQQAQGMGLLSGAKLIPQPNSPSTQTLLLNRQPKTLKLIPQGQAKILPATQTTTITKAPQRIYLKTAASTSQTVIPPGQIIQLTGTQTMASNQLHQINIPGKGMQYIKFVSSAGDASVSTSSTFTTLKTIQTSGTPTSIVLSEISKPTIVTSSIAPKPIKPMVKPQAANTVMVVPNFLQTAQTVHPVSKVAIPNRHPPAPRLPPQPQPSTAETKHAVQSSNTVDPLDTIEANGIRPRKPCNCTKSQCLKLYCECFANGEFCYNCNCMNCCNNIENEDQRQKAIKACLDRNPNAFRPKIGKSKDNSGDGGAIRKHTKGCNCKRSGCLKNYCECYEAKIACSNNCKCIGCRNIEDSMDKKLRNPAAVDNGNSFSNLEPMNKIIAAAKDSLPLRSRKPSSGKQAVSFMSDDVVEATCQCLLTVSDNGESTSQDMDVTKSQIIREFGRCLMEIIEYSASYNLN